MGVGLLGRATGCASADHSGEAIVTETDLQQIPSVLSDMLRVRRTVLCMEGRGWRASNIRCAVAYGALAFHSSQCINLQRVNQLYCNLCTNRQVRNEVRNMHEAFTGWISDQVLATGALPSEQRFYVASAGRFPGTA